MKKTIIIELTLEEIDNILQEKLSLKPHDYTIEPVVEMEAQYSLLTTSISTRPTSDGGTVPVLKGIKFIKMNINNEIVKNDE